MKPCRTHSPHNMGQVDGAACCKVTCLRCPASIQRTLVLPAYMVHEYVQYVHSTRVCVHTQCKRTSQAAAEPATQRSCWQPTRAKLQSAGAQARLPPTHTARLQGVTPHTFAAARQAAPCGRSTQGVSAAAPTARRDQVAGAPGPMRRPHSLDARAAPGPSRRPPGRPRAHGCRTSRKRRKRRHSSWRPARGAFQPAPTYTPGPTWAPAL